MTRDASFNGVKFEAPGPGPWEIERAHFMRPITRFAAAPFTRAMPRGFAEGSARYGLLISHLKPAVVNGFMYSQLVVHGAPEGASGPPPKPLLWLLLRLHPGMRARIRQSRRAFEEKLWREDLDRWDRVDRPRATESNLAVQAIDPASLDTGALIAHLRRAEAHMADMVALHHRYNFAAVLPIGDYLAHVGAWTGASPGEALALLQGTTPLAKGVATEELQVLAKALRESAAGREALARRGDAQATLDALAALEGDVGPATRAYLDLVRFRTVGYDVSDKTGGELPDTLVRAIRAAVEGDRGDRALAARDAKERALRERVPAAHRAEFDALLREARHMCRLRDERALYTDSWGTGLARRAVLEAGRRLAAAGKVDDPEHAADLTLEEMIGLLRDRREPSAAEIAGRARFRATATLADAPPWLNAPPPPPPPLDVFPAAARRASLAVETLMQAVFKESEARNTETTVRGLSINEGVYEGTARVVIDPDDFGRIQQGDVLVTRATSASFNVVLPLLGAIVTDRGGQLCHAAIVAREYGIPGVVGTREATVTIPDGARVRVDGAAGEVTIVAPAPARRAQEAAL
ncbi:PEP-utilizing enzyme [Sorangium sp. So ce1097]|uniref:PEP-utilizing enzyme n=1 Tax=Sorangium sp. So ce1097 TaxID=3133330 RepID=UPI003F5ECC41